MAKYTEKPKVVDAVQWTGDNKEEIKKLVGLGQASFDVYGLILHLQHNSLFVTQGNYVVMETKDGYPKTISEFKFKRLYSPKKK